MQQKSPLALHTERVASLVFVADRAISIVRAAGEGIDGINAANLGELFSSLHDALIDTVILAVAKIFERPTRRYPLWSLPSLLAEIETGAERLAIMDKPRAVSFLRELDPKCILDISAPDRDLTRALVAAMRGQLPDPESTEIRPQDLALDGLRQQRDKVIAHNEALDRGTLLSSSWQDVNGLLDLAKVHIGIVGWVFLNTVYMTDDRAYPLADDAARSGMAMRRLLTKAGLRAPRHPSGAV